MHHCSNCGSAVTATYVRVFARDDSTTLQVCPRCPDRVRDGAGYRKARGPRA